MRLQKYLIAGALAAGSGVWAQAPDPMLHALALEVADGAACADSLWQDSAHRAAILAEMHPQEADWLHPLAAVRYARRVYARLVLECPSDSGRWRAGLARFAQAVEGLHWQTYEALEAVPERERVAPVADARLGRWLEAYWFDGEPSDSASAVDFRLRAGSYLELQTHNSRALRAWAEQARERRGRIFWVMLAGLAAGMLAAGWFFFGRKPKNK